MPVNTEKSVSGRERSYSVTMEDVARQAGVTATTVARAIRGVGYVSPATRDKVLNAARDLNYSVNTAARTLATGRTGVVALITNSIDQIYYGHLVHLWLELFRESGYQMKLLQSRGEVKELLDETRASAVDGVLVSGFHTLSEEAEFQSSHLARRCVFLDTFAHPTVDFVRIDVRSAVRQALEMMMKRGCRRIAYVGNGSDEPFKPEYAHEDRLKIYVTVMQEAGLNYEYINSRPLLDQKQRIQSLVDYFSQHGCPDGIICLHDEIALYTHRALSECNHRVPDDVILMGCDGLRQTEWVYPPLTTVTQPFEEGCALAWQFLKRRIENPELPLQQATLQARLEVRGFTTSS